MSFAAQLSAAIEGVRNFAQADALSRSIWRAHAAGILDDAVAQSAAEALQGRKASWALPTRPAQPKRAHEPRRPPTPRSPDRERSLRRRRACATSGAVPSRIAASFTMAENAVLSVVAGECRRHGSCSLPIDAIAAMAGTSRSVVKRGLKLAAHLGLVAVEHRPRPGAKSLPNIVRIVASDWRAWLRLGDRGPKLDRHGNQSFRPQAKGPKRLEPAGFQLGEGRTAADGPPNALGAALQRLPGNVRKAAKPA